MIIDDLPNNWDDLFLGELQLCWHSLELLHAFSTWLSPSCELSPRSFGIPKPPKCRGLPMRLLGPAPIIWGPRTCKSNFIKPPIFWWFVPSIYGKIGNGGSCCFPIIIYIYIYMCVCVCIYIIIYIYISWERVWSPECFCWLECAQSLSVYTVEHERF